MLSASEHASRPMEECGAVRLQNIGLEDGRRESQIDRLPRGSHGKDMTEREERGRVIKSSQTGDQAPGSALAFFAASLA